MLKVTLTELEEMLKAKQAEEPVKSEEVQFLTELLAYGKRRETMTKKEVLLPTDMAGVKALYKSLMRLQHDIKVNNVTSNHADNIEADLKHLRKIMRKPELLKGNNTVVFKAREIAKGGKTRGWFEHDGIKFYKPDNVIIVDEDLGVYATGDRPLTDTRLDLGAVEQIRNEGNFILLLEKVNTRGGVFAAVVITSKEILRSREQRLALAHTGGNDIVAQLIERDIEGPTDKRIKDTQKLIDKYTEDYLASANPAAICKDLHRITQMQ